MMLHYHRHHLLKFLWVRAGFFTRKTFDFRVLLTLVKFFLQLIVRGSFTYSSESDVECLEATKDSLGDPNAYLTTWNFDNKTEGFICNFTRIDCWHPDENRVLSIRLGNMELEGRFPLGVAGCSSLTSLDLSNNTIYGNIPNNISNILGFLTSLDLSSNQLSGKIPLNLANCTYLNVLKLNNNQLSGQIPAKISQLNLLKEFSAANNKLTDQVPQFSSNATILPDSYANNARLCGNPLPPC
ncbi:probably inactive leucine-rich repeat receptor kinase At5g48380 [Olea europaea subsp. europaea]|uniref:Probably inactive leucine-rich repeat receptor kinase At5g48380 n=1 Tax=Olea europaea subsp. europaea TaxID=158383 RepID=A0A8S0QIK1_OLEEU|nr:probably inactive leucine-rich repeat receptor kinase At5g48380 [Olea europaea subsp. europaea]